MKPKPLLQVGDTVYVIATEYMSDIQSVAGNIGVVEEASWQDDPNALLTGWRGPMGYMYYVQINANKFDPSGHYHELELIKMCGVKP